MDESTPLACAFSTALCVSLANNTPDDEITQCAKMRLVRHFSAPSPSTVGESLVKTPDYISYPK
jgi:hypothetical protein